MEFNRDNSRSLQDANKLLLAALIKSIKFKLMVISWSTDVSVTSIEDVKNVCSTHKDGLELSIGLIADIKLVEEETGKNWKELYGKE